jgi:hypothetical protein
MPLLDLPYHDQSGSEADNVDIRIQFENSQKLITTDRDLPSRISGSAEDLADCDAVSTCPSDSESVVLFDATSPQSAFVCGSSVIFRNLRPEVLTVDVASWLQSVGFQGEINCPTFQVMDSEGRAKEFNFGFCTVRVSAPEEAVLLNYVIHSTGLDELFSSTDGAVLQRSRFPIEEQMSIV